MLNLRLKKFTFNLFYIFIHFYTFDQMLLLYDPQEKKNKVISFQTTFSRVFLCYGQLHDLFKKVIRSDFLP